jgi:hypothetical protein
VCGGGTSPRLCLVHLPVLFAHTARPLAVSHATANTHCTQTGREIYERLLSCTVDEILDDDELLMVVSNGAFYYKRRSL